MQNSERLIALIKTVCEENWSQMYYDLFLTDKRVVLIHKKSKLDANYGSLIGGAAGGIVGAILVNIIKNSADSNKKKKGEFEGAPSLDELLKVDKKNFAVKYEDLKWFKLNRSRSERCSIVFRTERGVRTFYLIHERVEQLYNVLPDIVALNEKLVK
jgi:hypothetical protein